MITSMLMLILLPPLPTQKISIYLAAPTKDGFVDTNKAIQDPNKDVRKRLGKDKHIAIVDDPAHADVVLTIVGRGIHYERTSGATAVYLGDVEVSPKCQGQGLGIQLMAAVVDHARAWPVNAVRTSAYDGVAGAGAFYAKCGFRAVGRVTYRTIPMIFFEMIL